MAEKDTLGRCQKKISDQKEQIRALKAELSQAETGARELCGTLDGILIALALAYGEETEAGRSLFLPPIAVEENRKNYSVSAAPEAGGYRITAVKNQQSVGREQSAVNSDQ